VPKYLEEQIMKRHQVGHRAEFRKQQSRRVMESASLSASFPRLKSLKVDLSFCTPDGATRSSEVKYAVNLEHAKTVFQFDCLNNECVRGDFDLSEVLAKAVVAGEKNVEGEICCHGWRNKDSIEEIQCRRLLRYKLNLGF
jgi:hypothetical protein